MWFLDKLRFIFFSTIAGKIFFIIFLCLIFYIFYRSEILFKGLRREEYFFYYIISLLFYIILVLLQNSTKSLFFITITITFLSYITEGILNFNSKEIKSLSKFEIYQNLKENGVKLSVPPVHYISKSQILYPALEKKEILPLSGISNVDTIICNELGYYSIIQTDRFGFNNPDNEWDVKNIEYLILGDSNGFGNCVNRPNDIGSLLRFFSKKNVINLSYQGNGPLLEYAQLKEYFTADINAKKIILIFTESNDLSDLTKELKSEILNKYLENSDFTQNLIFRQKEINIIANEEIRIFEEFKKNEVNYSKIIKYIKLTKLRQLIFETNVKFIQLFNSTNIINLSTNDENLIYFKKILQNIKKISIDKNSDFYVVYMPTYGGGINRTETFYKVKEIIEQLNIKFLDLYEELFKNEVMLTQLFSKYEHLNEEGYYKTANTIFKFTSKN